MSEMALKLIRQAKAEKWKTLDLGKCGIVGELPAELGELVDLEELNLSTVWWDPVAQTYKESRNDGAHNEILALGAYLPPDLTSLVADGLRLHDASGLALLTSLRSLDLEDNALVDIKPLEGLLSLEVLHLGGNRITDIKPLKELLKLRKLYIGRNQIADIKPLERHLDLVDLYLWDNQISDINPLKGLLNLRELSLKGNKISDIKSLAPLLNLESLNLEGNQIADISPLARLKNLAGLDISHNKVEDISPLAGLKNLATLDISHNQVEDISPLAALHELATLELSHNQVADIRPLAALDKLETLNLRENQVADISPLAGLIAKGIKAKLKYGHWSGIYLEDCPLSNPPVEIVKQGNEAILWYLDGGKDVVVREAKVLLVGEPESGKSSLYLRMFEPEKQLPKLEERTDGIDIHPQIIHEGEDEQFQLNIWDFGGQEVMHNTHQFFFSKRSVYILLVKGSQNISRLEHEYFREWLGWIDLLGDKSPILFFQNRIGGHGEPIEVSFFQRQFQQVKDAFGGDLLSDGGSAQKIRKALEYYAGDLTLLNSNWKERHLRIRRELEALPKGTVMISWKKFRAICSKHGETEESGAKHLSNFFHEIGVCLHYQALREDDVELLAKWVILDNQWATKGVYQMVLDDQVRQKQFGRFTIMDQKRVWNSPKYARRHEIMVRLMERFEICYPLADVSPKTWLIPQHLHAKQPSTVIEPVGNVLLVRYEYEFIPKGILNRLMTRMNRFVKDSQKAWRDGIVFEREGAALLARLNFKHDQISLAATGDAAERLKLLTFITDDLERIHKEFENIKVEKWIPCRCVTCDGNPQPHAYKYSKLMNMKLYGERGIKVKCDEAPFQEQSVENLLNGFKNETDPDGSDAKWKQAGKLAEDESGEFKGMMRDFQRDQQKILKHVEQLPVIHEKVDQIYDLLSDADRKIVEMLGLQAKHKNELVALLAGQEAILAQNDAQLQEYMDDMLEAIENAERKHEELFVDFAMALSTELRELWPKASDEPIKAEMKGKWKFTIPFIPGFLKYELEAGTDYSKAFQKLIDGLGGAADRSVVRLQDKARKVWERSQKLLGSGR